MQKRKAIPVRERLSLCRLRAREFVRENDIGWLPVDPFEIFDNQPWQLLTVKQAQRVFRRRDPLRIRAHRADAKTIRLRSEGCYITVYDEARRRERVRFTLAHEIGHIVLGHLTDFEETCIARSGGLTASKNAVLEKEANSFASELLTPLPVLRAVGARSAEDVVMLCDVSRSAAEIREGQLRHQFWNRYCDQFIGFYESQFARYLEPVAVCGEASNLPPFGFQLEGRR